jgi:hypothetical protein
MAQQADHADMMMEAAARNERVDGDLKAPQLARRGPPKAL